MRKLAAIIFFLSVQIFAFASDDDQQVKNVVHYWNSLHNNSNPENFKLLYSKQMLFYGRSLTAQKCYETKKKFLNAAFEQEITSPIKLKYYSSGVIQCLFTKRVTNRSGVKEHKSYLLVEKQGDEFVVTGESDLETDQNLGVQLNLGDEIIVKSKAKGNYILYSASAVLLTLGGVYFVRRSRSRSNAESIVEPELSETYVTTTQPAIVELQTVLKEAVKEGFKEVQLEAPPEKKGYEFEKYVVKKFDKTYFKILQWQSDKFHAGHFPLNNLHPDMVFQYTDSRTTRKFAVECKWRAELFKGRVELARMDQLNNYKEFSNRERMPVFIVLGLGGTPTAPENVYVIPLDEIRSNCMNQKELDKYYRYKKGDFFLRTYNMVLE